MRTKYALPMIFALPLMGGIIALGAQAYNIDQPHFQVDPVVIVWAADDSDGTAPVVVDFIVQDGGGIDTDLVNLDGRTLIQGELIAKIDATSSVGLGNVLDLTENEVEFEALDTNSPATFSAFPITDTTDITSDEHQEMKGFFFVASNAPFNISAQASALVQTGELDLSSINLRLLSASTGSTSGLSWGSAATTDGATQPNQGETLNNVNGIDMYQMPTATATGPGSIADQSIRLHSISSIGLNGHRWYDLSKGYGEIQAEIVYTVYMP